MKTLTRLLCAALLLAAVRPAAAESAEIPAAVVVKPAKLDPKKAAPLLVFLHGYGDTAANAARQFKTFSDRAKTIILCVNASGRLANGGWEWVLPNDEERILAEIERVRGEAKIGPVYLSGFSQGGHVTYYAGLRNPKVFRGIIPIGGNVVWLDDASIDASFVRQAKGMPIYIIHGEKDSVIPFTSGEKALAYFEKEGFPVHLYRWPGDHQFPPAHEQRFAEAIQFIEKRSPAKGS